jgi:hypothetical protein
MRYIQTPIWLIILTLCDFAHLEFLENSCQIKEIGLECNRNKENAVGAVSKQIWPSHDERGSQSSGCGGNTAFLKAARKISMRCFHLRGGDAGAYRPKSQSCYPLHGEGDTEGRDIGTRADPYSVASVSAAPPSAIGEIERIYMEVLRDNPKDIVVRSVILLHC